MSDFYTIRVGNKTYRINRETGAKELVETRDFERKEFELKDGAWRPKRLERVTWTNYKTSKKRKSASE